MNNNNMLKVLTFSLISTVAILSSGCSSDEPETAKTAVSTSSKSKPAEKDNNVDYGEASDSVKNQFIKTFSKNCVTRELNNSNNAADEKRFQQSCDCIAQHIAEDLADVDAEKYLEDHEDTHTLQIKFDAGAFFCLQNKPQPKGPHLFGK
jgi:hypothetical protein